MLVFNILAFTLVAVGALIVILARWFVDKYELTNKTMAKNEDEMDEEELEQYKKNKAVLNLKVLGMIVLLPGMILLLILYK